MSAGRHGWFGITVGVILLVPAILGVVWGVSEERAVHRESPDAVYDDPIPPLLVLVFGWPGLLVLGVSLIRKRQRFLRILGGACLLLVMVPLAMLLWFRYGK